MFFCLVLLLSVLISPCVFLYITPLQLWSSYHSVSTYLHVLVTTSSVFLSTWPNHLSRATLIFSLRYVCHTCPFSSFFILDLLNPHSLFPSSISTFSSLFFLTSSAQPFSVPSCHFHTGLMTVLYYIAALSMAGADPAFG